MKYNELKNLLDDIPDDTICGWNNYDDENANAGKSWIEWFLLMAENLE